MEPETPEHARPLSVAWPTPMIDAVDAYARRCGVRRSAAFRDLVSCALSARGYWPPRAGAVEASDGR